MTRIVATTLLALALGTSALAADRTVHLTLDGRPVDRSDEITVLHNGIVYADLIDLVKAFNGIMSYRAPSTYVTVNGKTAVFTPGSRTMRVQRSAVPLPGAIIHRKGDLYVPLDAFATQVAGAKVRHLSATRADIVANANPIS
jgi:archaellum component FlaF (FlaF/FlaG flagellin family)